MTGRYLCFCIQLLFEIFTLDFTVPKTAQIVALNGGGEGVLCGTHLSFLLRADESTLKFPNHCSLQTQSLLWIIPSDRCAGVCMT